MLYTFRRIYNIQVSRDLPSVHNTDPRAGFHNKRYTFRRIDTIQVSRDLVFLHHSVRRYRYRNNFRRLHYSLRGCKWGPTFASFRLHGALSKGQLGEFVLEGAAHAVHGAYNLTPEP